MAKVSEVSPDRSLAIAPFLALLLGIPLVGDALSRVQYVEPPLLRRLTFQAVTELVRGIAERGPLVLAFEDLHWVDATSLALIEELLPLTEVAPLMLVAIFRPQPQEPSWHFHETAGGHHPGRYVPIILEPLDEVSSRQLVANLLEIEDLPEKVRSLILTRAEGNPFFVEEMIRTLLDTNAVVRDGEHWRATREIETIAVPETLAGVIGARLDRLAPESKRTIQIAAVVGREFANQVMEDVAERDPGLDRALADLERRELIRETSRQPELSYRFKHVLTQDSAYTSLLLSRRREVHGRVALSLERIDPTRVYDIARHFLEARDSARALPYLVDAGDRSARVYATAEAIDYFSRALDLLKTNDNPAVARRAYEGLGQANALIGNGRRAIEIFHEMIHYAESHGDVPMRVSALNKISSTLMWGGQFAEIDHHLGEAESLARQHHDIPGLAELFIIRCSVCMFRADFSTAVHHLGESVQVGRELQIPDLTIFGLTHSANMFLYMSRFGDMWESAQEAYAAALAGANLRFQSDLLAFPIAFHHLLQGNIAEALRAVEAGVALAVRINYGMAVAVGRYLAGTIYAILGDYEKAIASYEESAGAGRALGWPFVEAMGLAGLATVHHELGETHAGEVADYQGQTNALLELPTGMSAGGVAWLDLGFGALASGQIERADELFQLGLTVPTMHGQLNRPLFLMASAIVALARGNAAAAAEGIDEARECVRDRGMVFLYPQVDLVDGRAQAALGNASVALDRFADAESRATELGFRPLIWQARAATAELFDMLGRDAEANTKREAAQAGIEAIAARFADAALGAAYRHTALARVG